MRRRRSKDAPVVPVSLLDIYREAGDFSAKFLLRPEVSAEHPEISVDMLDPDGREMPVSVHRWGTKVHVSFRIDGSVPDGVSLVRFTVGDRVLNFATWIFK